MRLFDSLGLLDDGLDLFEDLGIPEERAPEIAVGAPVPVELGSLPEVAGPLPARLAVEAAAEVAHRLTT